MTTNRQAKERRGQDQSAAARELVVIHDDAVDVIERPKPPPELTPEERDEWQAICAAVPATYFAPSMHMVLVSYCRAVVMARHLWQMIQQCERQPKKVRDLDELRGLMREHRAYEGMVSDCLRTMRLTHLANYAHDRTPLPEATPKPWLS